MKYFIGIAAVALGLLFSSFPASAQQRYWFVGNDTSQVWSLEDNGLVSTGDARYSQWLAHGNLASKIASTSELYDVISASFPDHLAASAPGLETLGGLQPPQSFLWRRSAGLNIVYSGEPSLSGLYPIDDQWFNGLATGALLSCNPTDLASCTTGMPFGLSTYTYLDKNFHPHTMSIPQMVAIVLAIRNYVAQLFAQLQVGLGGGTPVWPSQTMTVP
jgi:hypothetical protein